MKIHALARASHLADHIGAVWHRLPEQLRGSFLIDQHARAPKHWDRRDIVMVASYLDIFCTGERRTIYVEHGAGQKYVGKNLRGGENYYHGGSHPDYVIAYLGPRQDVVDSWGRPGFACGSPICDPYQLFAPDKVAAITFHNSPQLARLIPEAGSAFDHYAPHMERIVRALRDHGYEVLGHRHPRFNHLRGYWEREHGIPEATVEEVRTRASLLIADNTSLMYEMSYLFRDVIALNAPWYRRDVEHGLRFWNWSGPQVDDAGQLLDFIEAGAAYYPNDGPPDAIQAYGQLNSGGHDGLRAATWVTTFVASL